LYSVWSEITQAVLKRSRNEVISSGWERPVDTTTTTSLALSEKPGDPWPWLALCLKYCALILLDKARGQLTSIIYRLAANAQHRNKCSERKVQPTNAMKLNPRSTFSFSWVAFRPEKIWTYHYIVSEDSNTSVAKDGKRTRQISPGMYNTDRLCERIIKGPRFKAK